jgi:hypothetical protein
MVRSSSRLPRDKSGFRDEQTAAKVRKMSKVSQRKLLNKESKIGGADRSITEKKPKHLFCGKLKWEKLIEDKFKIKLIKKKKLLFFIKILLCLLSHSFYKRLKELLI